MTKNFEELQIRDDFMFCTVMSNPKFCKPFLERVLGIKISHIEYPKAQKTINISDDAKSVRLDIHVEDGKNTIYTIEMQTTNKGNIPKRTRYYQGMTDLNILAKGSDYKKLKRSIIIFVCTFDVFGEGRHIYSFENRCIQNPELGLGDGTMKIILNTKGTMDDISPEMKKLLDYIDGNEPEDDFTRGLDNEVRSVRSNEKWRLDYMTLYMKYQEKYEEGYEDGIEQGIEQGIGRGRSEKERETALKMLKKGKLSFEEIAEYTGLGLTEVEQLAKIQTV